MMPDAKRTLVLAAAFLFPAALTPPLAAAPAIAGLGKSEACLTCHEQGSPGLVAHWRDSAHARAEGGVFRLPPGRQGGRRRVRALRGVIATVVTPRDCSAAATSRSPTSSNEPPRQGRATSWPRSTTSWPRRSREPRRRSIPIHPRRDGPQDFGRVNGMASVTLAAAVPRQQGGAGGHRRRPDHPRRPQARTRTAAHERRGGGPDPARTPTAGRSLHRTWPNTGIGRINLDGSLGSCSACHSRHDFSPRRARQPENCGKCHLGPDHPQKEIYEESKHGVAYRDLKEQMNLDAKSWVLGKDYSQAPTCATCHMSGNRGTAARSPTTRASGSPGLTVPRSACSWTPTPHKVIKETDPAKRAGLDRRHAGSRSGTDEGCLLALPHPGLRRRFYQQYDEFVVLYNEKFAKPGKTIVAALANRA